MSRMAGLFIFSRRALAQTRQLFSPRLAAKNRLSKSPQRPAWTPAIT